VRASSKRFNLWGYFGAPGRAGSGPRVSAAWPPSCFEKEEDR